MALYEAAGFVMKRQVIDFYRAGGYAERGAYEMVLLLA